MISVSEAEKQINQHIIPLEPVNALLQDADSHVLATDVMASTPLPPFAQSSMDGYAFNFNHWKHGSPLFLNGEIQAGALILPELAENEAIRIFTGAPVPESANTVVKQEDTTLNGNQLFIQNEQLVLGANVRLPGTEIKAGEIALPAGTHLNAACIGFLAGLGIAEVSIYPKPHISIIITGKELVPPGSFLLPGQVFESNSFQLKAALHQLHIPVIQTHFVDDDLNATVEALKTSLAGSDMVLLAGGISVGDYDYVLEATRICGVTEVFHRIKQKPGKPIYFGMHQNQPVFGLPGNPASALTCFYVYVMQAIQKMSSQKGLVRKLRLPLGESFQKPVGLTWFLKGHAKDGIAWPLLAQESFRLSSFAKANCLIKLDAETGFFQEGDVCEVLLYLPL